MKRLAVLFVCTGNICRSPTAEGILRTKLDAAGLADQVIVDSAGTHGYHIGEPPDPRSIRTAARRGYDIANQRARRLETEDFSRFDYILALDQGHLDILQSRCVESEAHRLGKVMDFSSSATYPDVPDPYYGNTDDFELVVDLLEEAIDGLLLDLKRTL